MGNVFRSFLAFIVFLFGVASLVLAWFTLLVVHSFVMDGMYDAREKMGDGPRPGMWSEFFHGGWYLAYLPVALFGAVSLLCCTSAIASLRRRPGERKELGEGSR